MRGVAKHYFGVEHLDSFAIRVDRPRRARRGAERKFDMAAYTNSLFFLVDVKSNPTQEYAEGS